MERVSTGWSLYFDLMMRLLEESQRQYGIANQTLTQHFIERIEHAIQTCRDLRNLIEQAGIRSCSDSLSELLECLRSILTEWKAYQDNQDSLSVDTYVHAYSVALQRSGNRGRPRFDITKEQLEHLFSLSFTTCEVAALLGISRTTLYRFVLDNYSNIKVH